MVCVFVFLTYLYISYWYALFDYRLIYNFICFLDFFMPDGVASLASFAFLHSWQAHDRVPRALISCSVVPYKFCNAYRQFASARCLVVYMQTNGHYVVGFGGHVKSRVVSFGVITIHLYPFSDGLEPSYCRLVCDFIFIIFCLFVYYFLYRLIMIFTLSILG